MALAASPTWSYAQVRHPPEVGEGQTPHAWFAGFLRDEDTPYAFVVMVENGGGGNSVAGTVAGKVLDVIVNGY